MLEDYRHYCTQIAKKATKVGYHIRIVVMNASNGLSDKGFEELLKLIKKLLSEGNTLPETTYAAKRLFVL